MEARYTFSTRPALMALTETHTRLVPPLAVLMRIRWRFGRNLRFVILVTCVPMPPLFFDCPFRLMIEPLTGRRPVIAQILAMMISSWLKVQE